MRTDLLEATTLYDHEKLALLVHSVPDVTIVGSTETILQLLAVGRSIWLTASLDYTELDGVMSAFIEALAALLN
jgi:hypothetical protein